MRDLRPLEQPGKGFRGLDGSRADKDRLAAGVRLFYFFDHRVELLAAGLENLVVVIDPDVRRVGRDRQHVELIDVVKLRRLRFGGAGHAREFLVEAEVVLDGDGREGLAFLFDGDIFLGFDRLVEAVGPAATRHFAAGAFVDDGDLVVPDDVVDVAFVEAVGLEQLGNAVDLSGLRTRLVLDIPSGGCP